MCDGHASVTRVVRSLLGSKFEECGRCGMSLRVRVIVVCVEKLSCWVVGVFVATARARKSLDPSEFFAATACVFDVFEHVRVFAATACVSDVFERVGVFVTTACVCGVCCGRCLRCGCVAVVHYVFRVVAHNTDRFEI